ncbi:hypothetical protein GCM10023149_51300 [Mucilaginibacter gynuensis]|uniref:Uncharacterized protein n=1 Tax=Mucilaginibacter gynuensis TaxID=1302236 RepID=A0ABP8HJT1_9SPHI
MKLMQTDRQCRKCNKGTLSTRVKRGFWVKSLLFWVSIKHFKCSYCDQKTYVLEERNGSKQLTNLNVN